MTTRLRSALLLVPFALLATGAAKAKDPWATLVGADRPTVVKAIGEPELEFVALLDTGAHPLQIPPMGAAPVFDEDGPLPERSAVLVLQYRGGARGMDYQVVLKDEKVLWLVAPPAEDEKSLAAVKKKYGEPVLASGEVFHADIERTWGLLAYPKKGCSFVRKPGGEQIVARVLEAPH